MALLINNAKPAGGDAPSTLDNEQRTLRIAVQDIFGIPNNTTLSNAGTAFTSGGLATVNLTAAAATAGTVLDIAAGHAQRDLVTAVGMGLNMQADTWNVNAGGNGETVAIGPLAFFGIPTWTSTGSSYTVTNAATIYVQGVPTASTNVTITKAWALLVAAGNVKIPNSLYITEQADADADIAGDGQVWVNTASPNELWFTDDAGTDFRISGALFNTVEDTTPQLGGHLDGQGFDMTKMGTVSMTEQAAANADVAGDGQIWVKTASPNELYFTDDAGTDFQLAVGVAQAVQSDIEAETDQNTYIPPDLIKHSPGVAKSWARVGTVGTEFDDSYNMTSVTRTGTGEYAMVIATDYSSSDQIIITGTNGSADLSSVGERTGNGTYNVYHKSGGTAANGTTFSVLFGDFP